jgi:hypothetical protein
MQALFLFFLRLALAGNSTPEIGVIRRHVQTEVAEPMTQRANVATASRRLLGEATPAPGTLSVG